MEDQQKVITKGRKRFWVVFDVILFGLYFLSFLILIDPLGSISFCDGLNDTFYSFGLNLILIFLMFPLLVVICIRLFFIRNRITNKKRLLLLLFITLLCNPIIALMSPIRPPGYKPFTRGFHQRMQERLNVGRIRIWLDSLDEEIFDGEYYDLLSQMNGNELSVPVTKEISNLSQYVHYLVFYKEDQMRCLRIEWGGALGHWGVVIGPEGMKIPSSDFSEFGEYRLKLEDGVYVWHELQ